MGRASKTTKRASAKKRSARFDRWPQGDVCKLIGLSSRHFRELVPEVFPEVPQKAGYDPIDVVARYVRYREQGRSADSAAAFKRRELEADARIKEARAGMTEGRLLELEDVRQTLLAIFGGVATELDAAPGRLVDPIVTITGGERTRVLEVLERQFRSTRVELADAVDKVIAERRASAAA